MLHHWKKTATLRKKELKELGDKNLTNMFEKWKLYSHPIGFELIDIDFRHMNLSNITLKNHIWDEFCKILNEHLCINLRDETANMLAKKLKSDDLLEGKSKYTKTLLSII